MMKNITLFFLAAILSINLMATETLTFKITNPRIAYNAGSNYLQFDILMKATAGGTYLYSSQLIFNVDVENFYTTSNPTFAKGFVNGQYTPFGGSAADKYLTTTNWNGNHINLAVYGNSAFNGETPESGAYSEVLATYQTLGTITLKLKNNTGIAGISIIPEATNGYQKYATGIAPNYADYYSSLNNYEGDNLANLYLGRIYNSTNSWTQYGGTVNWTIAENTSVWDGSAQTDNAYAQTNALYIYYGAKLIIPANYSLTATGNTELGGTEAITLLGSGIDGENTGNFIDNGTITYTNGGSLKMERFLKKDYYHYISSPIANQSISPEFVNTTANPLPTTVDFYKFNEPTNTWINIKDGSGNLNPDFETNFEVSRGYCIAYNDVDKTKSFIGTPNTGTLNFSATYTTTGGSGYNLIGNPYPSAISLYRDGTDNDFFDINSSSNLEGTAYFWDEAVDFNGNRNDYCSFNRSGGCGVGGGASSYIPDGKVSPGQSFFIKVNAPLSLSFTNAMRVAEPSYFYKDNSAAQRIWLDVANSQNDNNEILIAFLDGATSGMDRNYDGEKFQGNPSLAFYSILDNNQLSIQGLPALVSLSDYTIPLGINAGITGNYVFTLRNTENMDTTVKISFEDKLTGEITNLKTNPTYTCNVSNTGIINDRFLLHVEKGPSGINNPEIKHFAVYSSGNTIYIKSLISADKGSIAVITNTLGQTVSRNKISSEDINKISVNSPSGCYLVTVFTSSGSYTTKIFLNTGL